jgi:mono/diheme cytochrome c family protein
LRRPAAVAAALAAVLLAAGCAPRAPGPTPAAPAPVAPSPYALPRDELSLARGHRIAVEWCSACHIVEPGQGRVANPGAGAPRFADVAHRWVGRPAELRRFMDDLHLPMPTFRLWPAERDEVVAYLISLDPAGSAPR